MKRTPYPKYKPSGVEWLGDVPSHWEKYRISDLARYGRKTFIDGDWIESPYITGEGVRLLQTGNIGIGKFKEQGFRYISEETFKEFDCTEIFPGDVLICRLADPVGRACIAPHLNEKMITSVDVAILKLRADHLNQYIVYVLSSDQYLNYLGMLCRGGTRDRVSRSMLGQIRISLPPFPEQQSIATFLDRETGCIDALIAKKQRLLELLAEQRTALISRAVTRGLDASVKLKPSGVEWLGDVPEHWEVKDLKFLVSQNTQGIKIGPFGSAIKLEMMVNEEDGFIVYGQEHVIANDFTLGKRFLPFHLKPEFSVYLIKPKDILVTMMGTAGRCQIVPDNIREGIIDSHLMRIRLNRNRIKPMYFRWYFDESLNVLNYFDLNSKGSIMQGLNGYIVKNLSVPLPPLPEQQSIAAFLDRETSKIDALSDKVTTVIEKLKEYRTALISSAVTGKIDVREAV